MKKKHFLLIIFANLFFGLLLCGDSFGAWSIIDSNDWWNDQTYSFDDGDQLTFEVDVEIWQDDNLEQFLYGYQVKNLDTGNENFSQFSIHPGFKDLIKNIGGNLVDDQEISSGGSFDYSSTLSPFLLASEVDDVYNYAYFAGTDVNPTETSAIAWFTSYGQPGLGTLKAQGLGYDGLIPAPVPEPATMLLLGSGLLVFVGLGGRKYFK